jgi:hypothetical protein
MAHESAPFFFWFGAERGLAALMPFQRAMSDTGGAAAQQEAMRGVLSDPEWLDFAKAYAEGRIMHPQGGPIGVVPDFPSTLNIDAPGEQRLTLEPFALTLGEASYGCGVWGNRLAPDGANMRCAPPTGRAIGRPGPKRSTRARAARPIGASWGCIPAMTRCASSSLSSGGAHASPAGRAMRSMPVLREPGR